MNPSNQEIVFFSQLLEKRFPQSWKKIKEILKRNHINYGFLSGTKDIWARDYMPVYAGGGKFIQFRYNSSYIRDEEYIDEKTIPEDIPERNQFRPISSDIILDGGNVIRLKDKILISERVLKDNPNIPANELVNKLSELLNGTVYLVTDINSDMTGHVDGMARFLDDKTILVNDREHECKYWKKGLQKTLVEKGFELKDVPCFIHKERKYPLSAIGGYLNYLELDNVIILPIFASEEVSVAKDGTNVKELDKSIIDQFKAWFPHKNIVPIEINDVVRQGGLMNCISWHVL